jgi:hypothetical protein
VGRRRRAGQEAAVGIYSTLDYLHSVGFRDGRERGLQAGTCRQLGKLLLRHGKRRLGSPREEQQTLLDHLIDRVALGPLEQARDRYLSAPDWVALLADLSAPEARPADPEYLLPFEIDPEPMPPSIDHYAQVTMRGTGKPSIIHLRFQRLYQENIGAVLYRESQRLQTEHHCPVQTAVTILWTGADGPAMTGEYAIPSGGTFHYLVTRLWEKDVESSFQSISTVSYAPLCKFPPEQLPDVVRRMDEYIEQSGRDENEKQILWVVAYSSMGLRWPAEQVNALLAKHLPMLLGRHECRSTLSEGFYEGYTKGEAEGVRQATLRWVLKLGGRRLGEAPPAVAQALETERAVDRLEQLASRALKAASWQEVLAPN